MQTTHFNYVAIRMHTTRQNILNRQSQRVEMDDGVIPNTGEAQKSNETKMFQISKNIVYKDGFTILEILVAISVIALGFAGVFVLMQNSSRLIQQTQAKTIAINIAREGVEIIHNIRDTNRQRRPGNKDACRLKIDPMNDDDGNCSNDDRLQPGRYRISEKTIEEQKYFAAEAIQASGFENKETAQQYRAETQLCFDNGRREPCDNETQTTIILRAVEVLGLYDKTQNDSNAMLECANGQDLGCGDGTPKELRFCVHAHYIADSHSHIKLCSILTNFQP